MALAQQRPPTFRSRTVVTELEVHVTDAAGQPVTGLGRDDFVVREDDVAQVLIGVDAPDRSLGSPQAAAGTAPSGPADLVPPEAGVVRATNRHGTRARAWVLLVDDLRTPGFLREQMKACVLALVEGVAPDDWLALVPTSGDRRAAREFTRDRGALREAIAALRFTREFDGQRVPVFAGTLEHQRELVGGPPPLAPPRLDLTSADNLLISSVGNAASMLGRASTARGTMVLVTRGMGVALTDDHRRALQGAGSGSELARYDEWRETLVRVQRSGVTVHVVDPTAFDEGLARRVNAADRLVGPTARMHEFVTSDDPRAATRVIARESGGVYVSERQPDLAARRVVQAASGGYVLRYIPPDDALDDRLRSVTVQVRRPGVTVRVRSSYARVSDPQFERLRDEKPLGVAVAAVVPSNAIGLEAAGRLVAKGKRTSVTLALTAVDAPGVPLPPRDILEVLAVVVDMKGKTVAKDGGRAKVVAHDATLTPPDLVFEPLKPGRYQLRVAVRSVALDRTGSVFLDLDIPKP
ncbi:hypothetical protein TBR22_A32550 [Luteitalea sp. TBR-22]|nr:hypothetical protein TBR22_A32550 [Luteitalea sp. TBR-22]